jgi:hypothetical protein
MKIKLICVILVIIFLIIFIVSISFNMTKSANISCNKYHHYLSGMWVGDPEFLKKSNLKDLQIFLSPKNKAKRNGYIIMVNINNDIILNQPIELQEITPMHNQRWAAYNTNKKIKDDNFIINYLILSDIDTELFPKNITMMVSMVNGTLVIKSNNNIYALCEKDLISSAAAISAYEE